MRRLIALGVLSCSFALSSATAASAATVLVDAADSTSDASGCGDSANPCNTIQKGVDVANAADVVQVGAGTYADPVTVGKTLTIKGDAGPVVSGAVTLTAPGVGLQGLAFAQRSGTAVTVTGGSAEIHMNRFAGSGTGVDGTANAEDNFWGCLSPRTFTTCAAITGNVDVEPWLTLGFVSPPRSVFVNDSTPLHAGFVASDQAQLDTSGFPPTAVAFTTNFGQVDPTATTAGGIATANYISNQKGEAEVRATVDQATTFTDFEVDGFFTIGGTETPPTTTRDDPPTIAFSAPIGDTILAAPTTIKLAVADDHSQPLAKVYDGDKLLCTIGPPYECKWNPSAADVILGAKLRATVSDPIGQGASASRDLKVGRYAPVQVKAKPKPSRDKRAPYKFAVTGAVVRAVFLNPGVSCHDGKVKLAVKGAGVQLNRTVTLSNDCTFSAPVRLKRRGTATVKTIFLGTRVLAPARASTVHLRAG